VCKIWWSSCTLRELRSSLRRDSANIVRDESLHRFNAAFARLFWSQMWYAHMCASYAGPYVVNGMARTWRRMSNSATVTNNSVSIIIPTQPSILPRSDQLRLERQRKLLWYVVSFANKRERSYSGIAIHTDWCYIKFMLIFAYFYSARRTDIHLRYSETPLMLKLKLQEVKVEHEYKAKINCSIDVAWVSHIDS